MCICNTQAGKFKTALNYYTKVVDFLDAEDRYEGDETDKRQTLLVAGDEMRTCPQLYAALVSDLACMRSCLTVP